MLRERRDNKSLPQISKRGSNCAFLNIHNLFFFKSVSSNESTFPYLEENKDTWDIYMGLNRYIGVFLDIF